MKHYSTSSCLLYIFLVAAMVSLLILSTHTTDAAVRRHVVKHTVQPNRGFRISKTKRLVVKDRKQKLNAMESEQMKSASTKQESAAATKGRKVSSSGNSRKKSNNSPRRHSKRNHIVTPYRESNTDARSSSESSSKRNNSQFKVIDYRKGKIQGADKAPNGAHEEF